MIARAKIIYILIIEINKWFSFPSLPVFSKRKKKNFLPCFYRVEKTLVKIRENSKKLWNTRIRHVFLVKKYGKCSLFLNIAICIMSDSWVCGTVLLISNEENYYPYYQIWGQTLGFCQHSANWWYTILLLFYYFN